MGEQAVWSIVEMVSLFGCLGLVVFGVLTRKSMSRDNAWTRTSQVRVGWLWNIVIFLMFISLARNLVNLLLK